MPKKKEIRKKAVRDYLKEDILMDPYLIDNQIIKEGPYLEQAWLKKPLHKPEGVTIGRHDTGVRIDKKKEKKLFEMGYNTTIHTHPTKYKKRLVIIPSPGDIGYFLKNKWKNMIIAQNDDEGNIQGYTILRKRKDRKEIDEYGLDRDIDSYNHYLMENRDGEKIIERLSLLFNKHGIRYKFVPMPGYEFDEKDATFIKKKQHIKGLEGKIEIIAIVLLGITFFLQLLRFPKIIGFTINLSNLTETFNSLTIILIFISFVLLFYAKIKRIN